MLDHVASLLLVEPDELIAELTAFRLELLGFRVLTVHRPDDGLREALDREPDVILLDLRSEDGDAIAMLRALSDNTRTAGVPVLALSTDADLHQVERAYRSGAKDYLVLPYDPAVLERKVRRLLTLRDNRSSANGHRARAAVIG